MLRFHPFSVSILRTGMGVLFATLSFSLQADGLRLPQTRVIFPADAKSVVAGIDNQSDNPYLVKAHVIHSPTAPSSDTSHLTAPFVVTPPLFRLEPHAHYSVRLLPQGTSALPNDRESVFYLSYLAIPSTTHTANEAPQVSIGLNTVIKLFYRPSGLVPSVEAAEAQLQFYVHEGHVVVRNPTPYYLTLSRLVCDTTPLDVSLAGPMLAPFSQQNLSGVNVGHQMQYAVINDFGGVSVLYSRPILPTAQEG